MLHIILYQPEIPPNTGNIIRLCANSGAQLHLIHPLGFQIDDKRLRRAGLDYHEWANVKEYPNYSSFKENANCSRVFACSTKGKRNYAREHYQDGDGFLFGPETRGLPDDILSEFTRDTILRIPMRDHQRSLNLSNAAAILIYEAWRQLDFQ